MSYNRNEFHKKVSSSNILFLCRFILYTITSPFSWVAGKTFVCGIYITFFRVDVYQKMVIFSSATICTYYVCGNIKFQYFSKIDLWYIIDGGKEQCEFLLVKSISITSEGIAVDRYIYFSLRTKHLISFRYDNFPKFCIGYYVHRQSNLMGRKSSGFFALLYIMI